jgi:hypothetical protein
MLPLIDGPGFVDAFGHTVFSYAHPIVWARFALVGDGGSWRRRSRLTKPGATNPPRWWPTIHSVKEPLCVGRKMKPYQWVICEIP